MNINLKLIKESVTTGRSRYATRSAVFERKKNYIGRVCENNTLYELDRYALISPPCKMRWSLVVYHCLKRKNLDKLRCNLLNRTMTWRTIITSLMKYIVFVHLSLLTILILKTKWIALLCALCRARFRKVEISIRNWHTGVISVKSYPHFRYCSNWQSLLNII